MRLNLLLAASFALALPAHGQDGGQIPLTFNHFALSVKELDRSADFYGRVLNLPELSRGARSNGVRWFALGDGKELHLISPEYFRGDAVQINKAVHLALTTSRFDDMLKLLDSKGIAYGNWSGTPKAVEKRSDGVRQVFLKDPDGYWIEINSVAEQ
jgi:catechol 2,3-dioxygenase-like lactoylglutathione lyase family enzyme